MDWIEFALAMILFMASHRLPIALGLKEKLSPPVYYLAYSVLSVLLLAWVISAAGRAPQISIWDQTGWQRLLVNMVMPFASLLAARGIAAPNPFAFEGRKTGFDPNRPGIVGITRQPLLWALLLWSGAHLLANGDLAHVILFGSFFAFSLIGMWAVERRVRRQLGITEWDRLTMHTGLFPFAALLVGRFKPTRQLPWLRILIGFCAWGALWHLHAPIIGVLPTP